MQHRLDAAAVVVLMQAITRCLARGVPTATRKLMRRKKKELRGPGWWKIYDLFCGKLEQF